MSVPPSLCLLPPDGSVGDKEEVIFDLNMWLDVTIPGYLAKFK